MSATDEAIRLRAEVMALTVERNMLRDHLGDKCRARNLEHGCILPAGHRPAASVLWHHDGVSVWCEKVEG